MHLKHPLPHATRHAQNLRKNSTPAETVLWNAIRNRKFHGLKFRRQVPIGRFIVDFLCMNPRLIIELDERVHDFRVQEDAERTEEIFYDTKIRVLRLNNEDVLENLPETLRKIERLLLPPTAPHSGSAEPPLSRWGREET